jgi:3-oxoacyl-[acyl-carrier-protein] synthase II
MTVVACERALGGQHPEQDMGLVLGSAFGALDATSAFMRRLREKGPRLASPADFPTLVPSSPAGHASIYLGLGGPAFVVADLSTSGECAFVQGFELVADREVDRMCVAAAEEKSAIVDAVLSVVFKNVDHASAPRREGAAALVLEAEDAPRAPGRPVLARVTDVIAWADDAEPLANVAPPPEGAVVVLANPSARALAAVEASPWRACRRVLVARDEGTHEAMGAIAIVRAVDVIVKREAPAALFAGSDRGWGYAGILVP